MQRCWNQEGTNYSLQSSTKWCCGKKEKKHHGRSEDNDIDQDLPMHLWEEATRIAMYVHNRISHSALGFKTPKEIFTGKKPEVSHLKIFGCPVYIHVPKEKRTKLDPSGKKGIFVGYCEVSKAFRIYIP